MSARLTRQIRRRAARLLERNARAHGLVGPIHEISAVVERGDPYELARAWLWLEERNGRLQVCFQKNLGDADIAALLTLKANGDLIDAASLSEILIGRGSAPGLLRSLHVELELEGMTTTRGEAL